MVVYRFELVAKRGPRVAARCGYVEFEAVESSDAYSLLVHEVHGWLQYLATTTAPPDGCRWEIEKFTREVASVDKWLRSRDWLGGAAVAGGGDVHPDL